VVESFTNIESDVGKTFPTVQVEVVNCILIGDVSSSIEDRSWMIENEDIGDAYDIEDGLDEI